jgi:hypothetical protein
MRIPLELPYGAPTSKAYAMLSDDTTQRTEGPAGVVPGRPGRIRGRIAPAGGRA